MDDGPGERDALSEGALVSSAPIRIGSNPGASNALVDAFIKLAARNKPAPVPVMETTVAPTTQQAEAPQTATWEVTVIKADKVEEKSFTLPNTDHQESATTAEHP
jgi:hypothetical protein